MHAASVKHERFVNDQLAALAAYDAQRPDGHPYPFHEHSKRVANLMHQLSLAMDPSYDRADVLYTATLAHDAGKRLLPISIWDVEGKPDAAIKALRRQHTSLGVQIVDDHFGPDDHDPFLDLLRDLMQNHHEAIDGSGWLGKTGEQLSLEARMLCVCDAFDGYSVWRPHYGDRDISPAAVIRRMTVEKPGQFDPAIMAVFAGLVTSP